MTTLFCNNLPHVDETDLKRLFGEFGSVHAVYIWRDERTGQSLGRALVEMDHADETQAAINGLNGRDWDGRTLLVTLANRTIPEKPNPTAEFSDVYVSGLPYETTADDLQREFSTVGDCRNARIIRGRDGSLRGVGFATMANKDDAQRVIDAFNGTDFHGRPISVSLARRRV